MFLWNAAKTAAITIINTRSYFTEVLDKIGSEFAKQVKEKLLGVD